MQEYTPLCKFIMIEINPFAHVIYIAIISNISIARGDYLMLLILRLSLFKISSDKRLDFLREFFAWNSVKNATSPVITCPKQLY